MSDIKKAILKITTLEELTHRNTPIHQLQPLVKLLSTVIFLITVISFGPNQVSGLIPYLFYPVILMTFAEIPFKPLFQRLLIALPFSLFAGLSNMIVSREAVFYIGTFGITDGMISFCSILLKTVLTVMAILILISTTSMNDLLYVMIGLRIPSILVLQIMMMFRYISVLGEEITVMYHAYILRAPREKGIKLKDMGPFLGQLIIRSFDRADRIYNAMKCRGFEGEIAFSKNDRISIKGWCYLAVVSVLLITMRVINISTAIGGLFV
jgi:cobalt/nickel transport system permease protein